MKTLLIGNFGAGNIGDELIMLAGREGCNDIVMTASLQKTQEFCEKALETVQFVPVGMRSFLRFIISKSYRKELFSLKNKVDKVVFAGGGLFAIKLRACLHWFLVFLWIKRLVPKVQIRFEHQGIDKNLGFFSKKLSAYVLKRADFISVRDQESVQAVQDLTEKEVDNVGDRIATLSLPTNNLESKEKIVLINAINPFDNSKIQKKFPEHEQIFIAFQESDRKSVPNNFKGEIVYPKTKTALFDLFQKAEYAVGERFHFILLSEKFCGAKKTFTLRKPYAEKVESFCRRCGINEI